MSDLNSELVCHADIVIFGIIIVFTLASLPRAYARFSRRINLNYNIPPVDHEKPSFVEFDNTDSSTACASLPSLPRSALPNDKALPVTPHRDPTLPSILHPVASVLRNCVHDNYSSNPFTDPERAGWVIASQIPFVYALATKNNIIGMMVGVGYEKLNLLHRLVGSLMVIGGNVHFLGYGMYCLTIFPLLSHLMCAWVVCKWSFAGDIYEKLADDYVRRGIVAVVCLDTLRFCSTEFVRSKSYNLFIATHVASPIVFLFTACYHEPACVPYVIAACVFYIFDHVIRAVKTRITTIPSGAIGTQGITPHPAKKRDCRLPWGADCTGRDSTARLRPLPELGITRVEVPSLNSGWCAGQHVRLRVLSSSMGWWGWTEVHPFTIANVKQTSEGMVLMCKRTGHWTSSLFSMAQTASYGETGKDVGCDVRVIVEGPYGGVGHTVMSSYSGAMFVVGGSGVSFALSAVQDLIQAATDVKVIDIVWFIQDPGTSGNVHMA
ncbi:hypothetical protein DFH29DRAFT_1007765 [Suillus ampliporus]|nr:hypothetical protein DFH29DRAFT_1007765 [Suillus ampliporus]